MTTSALDSRRGACFGCGSSGSCLNGSFQLTHCGCGLGYRWRAATHTNTPGSGASGMQSDDPFVECFWGAVRQLSEAERGMVLAFATGCPRLPTVGGAAPVFVLHINRHQDVHDLPVASTCTSTIPPSLPQIHPATLN